MKFYKKHLIVMLVHSAFRLLGKNTNKRINFISSTFEDFKQELV